MIFDLVALIGVTIIFTWSSLFEIVRRIYPRMLECALCVGFWVGLFGSLARHQFHRGFLDHFFFATTTAVSSFAVSLLLKRLVISES